jgi:hypothetical protein
MHSPDVLSEPHETTSAVKLNMQIDSWNIPVASVQLPSMIYCFLKTSCTGKLELIMWYPFIIPIPKLWAYVFNSIETHVAAVELHRIKDTDP